MTVRHTHPIFTRRAFHARVASAGFAFSLGGTRAIAQAPSASPLLDFHVHLTQGWFRDEQVPVTVPHLLHWMDAHEISQAVVLPLVSPEAFWYPISSEFVITETAPHRDRLIPFCAIDPRTLETHLPEKAQVTDMLKRYQDAGARGLGEHKPRLEIDHPASMRLYEACATVGLPVLFHLDNFANMDQPGLPRLARVLEAHPDLVLIGHGKGFWASIAGGLKQEDLQVGYPRGPVAPGGAVGALMERFPNLYGDLSSSGAHALLRDPDFGRAFLARHADRLLFGTDYYGQQGDLLQFTMFDELDASPEVRRKVGSENARRLLQLS